MTGQKEKRCHSTPDVGCRSISSPHFSVSIDTIISGQVLRRPKQLVLHANLIQRVTSRIGTDRVRYLRSVADLTSGNTRNTPYLNPSSSRAAGLVFRLGDHPSLCPVISQITSNYLRPKHRPAVKRRLGDSDPMLIRTSARTYTTLRCQIAAESRQLISRCFTFFFRISYRTSTPYTHPLLSLPPRIVPRSTPRPKATAWQLYFPEYVRCTPCLDR
jgi:hypothetical protein